MDLEQGKEPKAKEEQANEQERQESYLSYKQRLDDLGNVRFIVPNRNVNYSAKLYGSHFESPWQREASGIPVKSERWADSATGRAAIRTFSRGILGSALMTWGQMKARGYDPHLVEEAIRNPGMKGNTNFYQRTLGRIAMAYDTILAKPTGMLFGGKEYAERGNVRFRSKILFNVKHMEEVNERWKRDFISSNAEVRRSYEAIAKDTNLDRIDTSAFYDVLERYELPLFETNNPGEAWRLCAAKYGLTLPEGPQYRLKSIHGRSYGHEVAMMTHDFALGSIGDAIGRKIAGLLDPNVYTSWLHDGQFDPVGFCKFVAKSAWDIISYNQMEDWFAGTAYVYQMRWQRQKIADHFPGFKHAWDGRYGAFSVDKAGTITGDYMKANAIDLQGRFMGYNFYTLMFRDLYNHASYMFSNWKDNGYSVNLTMPADPIGAAVHAVDETVKYVGKAFVKSMVYMAPAVPLFWMWRVPQMKYNPLFIEPQNGPLTVSPMIQPYNSQYGRQFAPGLSINYENSKYVYPDSRDFSVTVNRETCNTINRKAYSGMDSAPKNIYNASNFDVYSPHHVNSRFSDMLNPLGRFSHKLGHNFGDILAKNSFMERSVFGNENTARFFGRNYVNNALAYTPYMIAKYETANWWDTPFMDAAIYRAEDGITSLNPKEVWEGVKDIGRVIALKPVSYKTYCQSFMPRGLINSTQEAIDSQNKADFGFRKSFAEAVRSANPETQTTAAAAAKNDLPPDAIPGTVLKKNGREDYVDISRLSDNGKGAPGGVTIH